MITNIYRKKAKAKTELDYLIDEIVRYIDQNPDKVLVEEDVPNNSAYSIKDGSIKFRLSGSWGSDYCGDHYFYITEPFSVCLGNEHTNSVWESLRDLKIKRVRRVLLQP